VEKVEENFPFEKKNDDEECLNLKIFSLQSLAANEE
jgi:hypothetical protein